MEEQELNEIRKRQIQESMKAAYIEEKKKEVMRRFLEGPAYERIMTVKSVNPELYDKVIEIIIQLAGGGRLKRKLGDKELVALLSRITERREPKIEIKRK